MGSLFSQPDVRNTDVLDPDVLGTVIEDGYCLHRRLHDAWPRTHGTRSKTAPYLSSQSLIKNLGPSPKGVALRSCWAVHCGWGRGSPQRGPRAWSSRRR